ncbi:General stress protein 16O [Symmachiella macrocystis]|uniref:General stress protein 16O n=1 Tax=Symmachiella macrocystis TaxID=2527985 RepID=A0A5C6B6C7_9PLAN|nr:TraR/DksA family transcriptional regulator [Symmachiella macrocystis]TWU07092.1 General stress protein 16O [Symmachiella macrocystis]
MTRKDALLRLHESLMQKRDDLREKLAEDLSSLGPSTSPGDICDEASEGSKKEIDSQLAALESRELTQIETAIKLIRLGRYGMCEDCETKIPVARLKALPYTPLCIECQRKRELVGNDYDDFDADWESAFEFEGANKDRDLTISDLDLK